MHDYTVPDVNMLHIAESSAENNKIKEYESILIQPIFG